MTRAANRAVLMCGSSVSGSALNATTSVPPRCAAPLGGEVAWLLVGLIWLTGGAVAPAVVLEGPVGAQPAATTAMHTSIAAACRTSAVPSTTPRMVRLLSPASDPPPARGERITDPP